MQEDKIRQALVELLYRNSYGVVISNIVISMAAVYVLRTAVSANWLTGWLAALYLLTAVRVLASRRFSSRSRDRGSILRWAWLATAFSCMSGLLWGVLGWVGFMPEAPIVLSFTVIVLTGLVCGTVPSLSAFPPALVGSILATVVPVALRCLTTQSDISGAFLFLLASLVAINFYYCRITYRMLRETVSLRLENETLVEHLQEERDRAQTADRAKTRFLASRRLPYWGSAATYPPARRAIWPAGRNRLSATSVGCSTLCSISRGSMRASSRSRARRCRCATSLVIFAMNSPPRQNNADLRGAW
ncbi:hypothetical protein [Mesorhizobium sp. ISC11]|uniref:hypothetical protein n=1 Tax=Mesorhizobium sp. ISC11 TaxID=3076428 RepID=UPI00301D120F